MEDSQQANSDMRIENNEFDQEKTPPSIDQNPTNLIKNPSSPWTALKGNMNNPKTMKFFGFRFMSVWVFPMALMGIAMEFLFISPIRNTTPFG